MGGIRGVRMRASGGRPESRSLRPVRTEVKKTAFQFMKPLPSGSAPQSETNRSWAGFRTGRAQARWPLPGSSNCLRHFPGQQQTLP